MRRGILHGESFAVSRGSQPESSAAASGRPPQVWPQFFHVRNTSHTTISVFHCFIMDFSLCFTGYQTSTRPRNGRWVRGCEAEEGGLVHGCEAGESRRVREYEAEEPGTGVYLFQSQRRSVRQSLAQRRESLETASRWMLTICTAQSTRRTTSPFSF